MKTIILLSLALAFNACELPQNEPAPVYNYVPKPFVVPEKMLGEYVAASHNINKGVVTINSNEITLDTEMYKITAYVDNTWFYNNCYIKITLPDGTIMQIWGYKGYDLINIKLIDEGVEYELGRFEPIKPSQPEAPPAPVYN